MAQLDFRLGQVVFHAIFWSIAVLMGAWMTMQDLTSLWVSGHPAISDTCGVKSSILCSLDASLDGYFTLFFGLVIFVSALVLLRREIMRMRNPMGALVFDNNCITFHPSFGIAHPVPVSNFSVLGLSFDPTQKRKMTEEWSFAAKGDVLNLRLETSEGRRKRYFISANLVAGGRIALSKFIAAIEKQR